MAIGGDGRGKRRKKREVGEYREKEVFSPGE